MDPPRGAAAGSRSSSTAMGRFTLSSSWSFALAAAIALPPAAALPAVTLRGSGGAGRPRLNRYHYTQLHMGVPVRILLYAPDEPAGERAATAAFARFAELEASMSDYRPASELMRLCARAGGPPVPVSPDLFRVLERAQEVARRSEGAFDVTVGPYVALWRAARREGRLPGKEALEQARRLVGWQKVHLDAKERTVRLEVAGMRLDLGGIAKGYACDRAREALAEQGCRRVLIEAGGDIVAGDPPPGAAGWRVRIAQARGGTPPALSLARAAISSSGDTEQYVTIDGTRYSHIVDPRTGLGLTSRVAVTVLAGDGLTTDSLATAVSVLGPERGRPLARTYGVRSLFVRTAGAEKP